jgi:hypothetical protein
VIDDHGDWRFVEPSAAEIGGKMCDGMNVRAGGHGLCRLKGFVVDATARRVKYLVVRTPGQAGATRLVPIAGAHVDQVERVIVVPDDIDREESTGIEDLPTVSDDDLAIMAERSVA